MYRTIKVRKKLKDKNSFLEMQDFTSNTNRKLHVMKLKYEILLIPI